MKLYRTQVLHIKNKRLVKTKLHVLVYNNSYLIIFSQLQILEVHAVSKFKFYCILSSLTQDKFCSPYC